MAATYSFLDFQCTLLGPGGSISLGAGAGIAKEGITFEFIEDTNTMTIGADGEGMHAMNGSRAGRVTVRTLKTSPTNGKLMAMYNFQRAVSANWGQNTLAAGYSAGDQYSCQQVAFTKPPSNTYGADAAMNEWVFDVVKMDAALATGI